MKSIDMPNTQTVSKLLACLLAGMISSFTITNHLFRFWGRSLLVQVMLLCGITLIVGLIIFLTFRSVSGPQLARRLIQSSAMILLVVAAYLYFDFPLRIAMPATLNTVEITSDAGSNDQEVALLEMKVQDEVIPFFWLQNAEQWKETSEFGYPSVLLTNERNYLRYEFSADPYQDVRLLFLKHPTGGKVTIKHNNKVETLDLYGADKEETAVNFSTTNDPLKKSLMIIEILAIAIGLLVFAQLLSRVKILQPILFTMVYIGIVGVIKYTNIPDRYFFESGDILRAYNIARLVALAYFFVIFYCFGKLSVKICKINTLHFTNKLDTAIFNFVVGSSILNIILFLLGTINAYYFTVGLIITTPLVYLSYSDVVKLAETAKEYLRSKMQPFNFQAISLSKFVGYVLIVTAFLEGIAILIVNTLRPIQEWDVFTHYLPYYQEVILNHGIIPNNVWYHFFYNKGSGLFFLSMLMTDKFGSKLISTFFFVVAILILYSLLKQLTKSALLRWFAICLFIPIFWNLSGYRSFFPSFAKLHIVEMCGLTFSIWLAVYLFRDQKGISKSFLVMSSVALIGFLIFSPKISVLLLPYFLTLVLWLRITRKVEASNHALLIFIPLVSVLLVWLGINYAVSGMLDDMPMRTMWKYANQQQFSEWWSPYMMLYLLEGSGSTMGTFLWQLPPLNYLIGAIRLDQFLFLSYPTTFNWIDWLQAASILFALIGFVIIARRRAREEFQKKSYWFVITGILIGWAIVLLSLLDQPDSLDRTYIALSSATLLFLVGLWEMGPALVIHRGRLKHFLTVILAIGWVFMFFGRNHDRIIQITQANRLILNPNITSPSKFVFGEVSIGNFIGASYDYYLAHQFAGEDQRILSLNINTIEPGRTIEHEIDYTYKEWHIMVFEKPEAAKTAFQREGLNYFLISLESPLMFGAIPFSPLFHPDNIDEYFDVIWKSEGKNLYLITWKDNSANVLEWDEGFLRDYDVKLQEEGLPDLVARVRSYYQKHGTNYPVEIDIALPPVKGWQ